MIVAKTADPRNVILVGINDKDIEEIKLGKTSIKDGSLEYGFSSLILFYAPTDSDLIKTLQPCIKTNTVRQDNIINQNIPKG
jgi:hypothetical protein